MGDEPDAIESRDEPIRGRPVTIRREELAEAIATPPVATADTGKLIGTSLRALTAVYRLDVRDAKAGVVFLDLVPAGRSALPCASEMSDLYPQVRAFRRIAGEQDEIERGDQHRGSAPHGEAAAAEDRLRFHRGGLGG